ncbi:MAG: autoinducer binding domain-containing protein [Sphingobium sp.]
MALRETPLVTDSACLDLVDVVIKALRTVSTSRDLAGLMQAITRDLGFRYYALIHHDDLDAKVSGCVDIKYYPSAVTERLFGQRRFRRDPIIRGCIFADSAFLWSDLHRIIHLNKQDHDCFEQGMREGLNEGITVPWFRLGECMGSCTLAGISQPDSAARFLGPVQMIGIFAFQAARRLIAGPLPVIATKTKLYPRSRDCVVLAGRGYSNKEIARALSITPRTVDGYLTEARRLFGAHDRTELVIGALLAGEVGLYELRPRQSE